MKLLKTSFLNGIAVLIKTVTGIILNKILAIFIGPMGYANIGQFQNFIQMITAFTSGFINTAIVKYTAEYHAEPQKQKQVWQTAGTLILALSIIFAVLIILFKQSLSQYIFHSDEYVSVLIWFALFLILFNLNIFFLAILNGKKEIKKLVIINILGSLFSLIISSVLAMSLQLYGVLIGISIYQSVAFFITLYFCKSLDWFKFDALFGNVDRQTVVNFGRFALMALVASVALPITQIVIRSLLVNQFNVQYAGYWEAMVKLSNSYLSLITTTISVYYIPRLAELKTNLELRKEIRSGYAYLFPLAIVMAATIFILKDFLIILLFSKDFYPMHELFIWQLIGDVFKISSWIIVYVILSKAMTALFLITEVFFSISYILLVYFCINLFGFKGVVIGYMLNYILYWTVMSFYIFRNLRDKYV